MHSERLAHRVDRQPIEKILPQQIALVQPQRSKRLFQRAREFPPVRPAHRRQLDLRHGQLGQRLWRHLPPLLLRPLERLVHHDRPHEPAEIALARVSVDERPRFPREQLEAQPPDELVFQRAAEVHGAQRRARLGEIRAFEVSDRRALLQRTRARQGQRLQLRRRTTRPGPTLEGAGVEGESVLFERRAGRGQRLTHSRETNSEHACAGNASVVVQRPCRLLR